MEWWHLVTASIQTASCVNRRESHTKHVFHYSTLPTSPSLPGMVPPTCTLGETSSILALTDWTTLDNSWRMLLQTDRASDEFLRLVMEILDAQRQSPLDVSQFTEDEVSQLIELIDTRVRDPDHHTCLMAGSINCRSFNTKISRAA